MNFTFTHANLSTTNECWKLTLYNADNENLLEMSSVGTATNETSMDIGLPAGAYYVKVHSRYGETENYTLRVNYSASGTWETENNDGYGNATTIALNTQYSGANQFHGDDDYYKFTLNQAGKISINFQHQMLNENITYWYVDIYNEKTEHLHRLEANGIAVNENSADIGLDKGTYYIIIQPTSSRYCDYTYAFALNYNASEQWEKEKNDGYATATTIALNTQYSGANQFHSDDDYYKFTIPSVGKISLNIQHPLLMDNSTYWYLYIYNEKVEKLLYTELKGTEYNVTTGEIGLPAGNYYLKIEPTGSRWEQSTYSFKVNYTVVNNWESELNDGYADADDITVGVSCYGASQLWGDDDYYRFILNTPNTIKVDFVHDNLNDSSNYWYVNIYSAQASKISGFDVGGMNINASSGQIFLAAGTYYIKVSPSASRLSTVTYQLKVSNVVPESQTESNVVPESTKVKVSKTKLSSVKAGKRKVTVEWKKVSGASGYEVYMSTKKSKGYKKVKTITSGSKIKYVKKGLKKKKTYYFKVRAYKKVNGMKVYGNYSKPKKVKVK